MSRASSEKQKATQRRSGAKLLAVLRDCAPGIHHKGGAGLYESLYTGSKSPDTGLATPRDHLPGFRTTVTPNISGLIRVV